MVAKLHTNFRNIGLPWLPEVPGQWDVQRGKDIFDAIDVRSQAGAEELLTVSSNHGVIPRNSANVTMFQAETYEGYKLCWPGDLVINSLWAWSRGLAVSNYHGIISSAYGVYRTKNGVRYDPRFVNYMVRSTPFQWELQTRSKGIWISRLQLTDEAFFAIPFPVPPPAEQTAIVRFLDHADEQIQRYIAAKERLIALLEEQRQALVHQAVTRGLDPSVRLKDSGVEWLGDVPEHWEVGPLKRAFGSMDYGISESASHSGAIPLLTMGNLRDGQVIVPHEGGVDSVDPYLLLREGDLLFNRTNSRELVGKVGLFTGHDSPTTFASYLVRMRPNSNHEPEYLNMVLNDTSFISSARRESVPSLHQSNLNPTRYGRLHIALPPKEEQSVILRVLQEETVTLRNSVARTRRQIDLMNEYRTRLTADVVTGQLDVREAAAQLEAAPLENKLPDQVVAGQEV